jgi:hypothetical protein
VRCSPSLLISGSKGPECSITAPRLVGLHGRTNGPDGVELYGEPDARASETLRPERRHPAVKKRPVTGRPVLFVNPTHTHGFEDVPVDEAARLIAALRDHATQERFVYYAWRVGDVVVWGEIATIHRGAGSCCGPSPFRRKNGPSLKLLGGLCALGRRTEHDRHPARNGG